jgi:uncharacterized membrane protein
MAKSRKASLEAQQRGDASRGTEGGGIGSLPIPIGYLLAGIAVIGATVGTVVFVLGQTTIALIVVAVTVANLAVATVWLGPGQVWRQLRSIHPAFVLATLDLVGLAIASYLSYEELRPGGEVQCAIGGCQVVAHSQYARPFFGIPVAVYGVILSITLFTLAIWWWRTGAYKLLLAHYGLSLVGVIFEGWFQFAQIFLIGAVCIWCESYGISLLLRFVVAAWVYMRTPNPASLAAEESS